MFSMAIGPLNVDLSGQFRKLLLDRCDADVAAAAFAAIAANGTEAEVLIEDGICLTNVSLRSFLWWTHSYPKHGSQAPSASRCRLTALQKVRRPESQPSLADVKVGMEWFLPVFAWAKIKGRPRLATELANPTL